MRADWVECTFDDVFELITNGSSIKQTDDKIGIPVSRIETIWNETIDWGRVKYAIDYDDNLHNKYLLKNGDILFSHINSDSHLGKTAIFRDVRKLIHGINLLLLRPFLILNSSYILYYLRFTKYRGGFLQIAQRSVNQSSINQRSLKQLIISLPPLPEQRAIVKKIEALFSSLDVGIADLKKAQDQLKIYRQAVLKKAFEGELTNSKGLNFVQLGSVIEKPRYGTSKKCTEEVKSTAVLRIPNIGDKIIDERDLKYADFEESELLNLALREGDILTIRSNGSVDLVGKSALITRKDTKYLFAGYLIRLRPLINKIDPKYLIHCLYSHDLRVQIEFKAKSTSGVNNINSEELSGLQIPLFPLEHQAQIVKEIEARLSVCDAVEQQVKDSLSQAEALRQSILKKAFEGKLLSEEEIKACQQEADYEPASVLLEKIKAEKEANKPVKKTKKK